SGRPGPGTYRAHGKCLGPGKMPASRYSLPGYFAGSGGGRATWVAEFLVPIAGGAAESPGVFVPVSFAHPRFALLRVAAGRVPGPCRWSGAGRWLAGASPMAFSVRAADGPPVRRGRG